MQRINIGYMTALNASLRFRRMEGVIIFDVNLVIMNFVGCVEGSTEVIIGGLQICVAALVILTLNELLVPGT